MPRTSLRFMPHPSATSSQRNIRAGPAKGLCSEAMGLNVSQRRGHPAHRYLIEIFMSAAARFVYPPAGAPSTRRVRAKVPSRREKLLPSRIRHHPHTAAQMQSSPRIRYPTSDAVVAFHSPAAVGGTAMAGGGHRRLGSLSGLLLLSLRQHRIPTSSAIAFPGADRRLQMRDPLFASECEEYHFDRTAIGVWGSSAGLVTWPLCSATSGYVEGVGGPRWPRCFSRPRGRCFRLFGPSDLTEFVSPARVGVRAGRWTRFMGGPVEKKPCKLPLQPHRACDQE